MHWTVTNRLMKSFWNVLAMSLAVSGLSVPALAAKSASGLSTLPPDAQGPISAALGKNDSGYWVRRSAAGFRAENPAQALVAEFTRDGADVHSGNLRWGLEMQGYGYGDAPRPVKAVAPTATANRVEYRRDALTEWYENGPLGLEQGFTLTYRPGKSNGQALTLALGLRGDLVPALEPGGKGLELRRKNEKAALRYTGLEARDATGRPLRSWLELRGERLLLRLDDNGARYPVVVDPWVQQAGLTASDGAAFNYFGISVAVSGTTAFVGAPFHTGGSNPGEGAVYVFVESSGTWAQQAELTASDGAGGDLFGSSVAVSGTTALIGADSHQVGANRYQGAVYVFVESNGTWTQQAELIASDGVTGDNFGRSVAVSGSTAIVGALAHPNSSTSLGPGAAYVFVESGGTWSQQAELTASDGAPNDGFGGSVAVSGSTVVVGAASHTVASNYSQGAAYVFVESNGTWTEQAEITASDGVTGDNFGRSVAVSGSTAMVGADLHTVGSNRIQGAVYVFVESGGMWSQQAELTASDGAAEDFFGNSVALTGSTAVVGAFCHPGETSSCGPGAAYVFVQSGGTWSQQAELTASDGATHDQFGWSVGVGGSTAVVGAPDRSVDFHLNQGAAYIFDNTSPSAPALQFVPVTPCRVADTRNPTGPFGGPELAVNSIRAFAVRNSSCGIPAGALAYSVNVTVVANGSLGYLTLWPYGSSQPLVSTLNSDGRIKANAAIVPAGNDAGGSVNVYATDPTQFILDIDGYFVESGSGGSPLAFYSSTPCRVADTRNPNGDLGGPYISGGTTRSFPIGTACGIPAWASAYSLNLTAVPHGSLDYITAWPQGQSMPLASVLNAPTGTVVANAAIIPAGAPNGGVSVYASDDTDLVIDIDGYFAPPGAAGALSLYTLTPCRVLDTRNGAGAFSGTTLVNVSGSSCAVSANAEAYVFNATVVPSGSLDYLTLWPDGQSQPFVSTLNAFDGAITSNMAIVPTTNGQIDAYATSFTQLILDISGYFAP